MIKSNDARVGFFICHCGRNIADTVDVEAVAASMSKVPGVVVSSHYEFMCWQPGQDLIAQEIHDHDVNRVVVAACSR